jgi:hypothetical protein
MSSLNANVSPTANPQVANYTLTLPAGASAIVQFGLETTYGRMTSATPAPAGGGPVSILVAGMLANSPYHMQAQVTTQDTGGGSVIYDIDHTFQTGTPDSSINLPTCSATGPARPGVELLNLGDKGLASAAVDSAGNILWWYYNPEDTATGRYAFPIKPLSNGNFIANITNWSVPKVAPSNFLREISLDGTTVRELSDTDLNTALAAKGFGVSALYFDHDVTPLPNGHILMLVEQVGINQGGDPMVGNAIIDLDENWSPVWVWSAFDHVDLARRRMGGMYSMGLDWTHANAIVYNPADKNVLLSIRHHCIILKIDYRDGHGTGEVIWTLGLDGDFTLAGGNIEQWFYGQHAPAILKTDGSKITQLGLIDNGYGRLTSSLPPLGPNPARGGCYTRAVIFDLDEDAKTASVAWEYFPEFYNWWGGNISVLEGGNIEFGLSQLAPPVCPVPPHSAMPSRTDGAYGSGVFEVTPTSTSGPALWQLTVSTGHMYRGFRMGSLYPGVQWS